MSDWTIYLEYRDAKSNKFWRGKTEGGDMHVNYGRIGSDGQTKVKTFASPDDARAELDKVANQKRKKGYEDAASASAAAGPAPSSAPPPPAKQSVTMTITRSDRPVELTITADGGSLTTTVAETFDDAADAAACYDRIVKALVTDGYTTSS